MEYSVGHVNVGRNWTKEYAVIQYDEINMDHSEMDILFNKLAFHLRGKHIHIKQTHYMAWYRPVKLNILVKK